MKKKITLPDVYRFLEERMNDNNKYIYKDINDFINNKNSLYQMLSVIVAIGFFISILNIASILYKKEVIDIFIYSIQFFVALIFVPIYLKYSEYNKLYLKMETELYSFFDINYDLKKERLISK